MAALDQSEQSNAQRPSKEAGLSGFHKLQEDLEAVIVKDAEPDSTTPHSADSEEPGSRHPDGSFRGKVDAVIHSQKFQVAIIALVVLDCLVVVAELLVEQEVFGEKARHHVAAKVLHYVSLSILSVFIVEILVRLYVLRLEFFRHKFELFDAVVVVVSFVLDIVFRDSEGSTSGLGLLILLRLWRALRVMNSINVSIKKQSEKKLAAERHHREVCERELAACRHRCQDQEQEIESLKELLRKHGIECPTPSQS